MDGNRRSANVWQVSAPKKHGCIANSNRCGRDAICLISKTIHQGYKGERRLGRKGVVVNLKKFLYRIWIRFTADFQDF